MTEIRIEISRLLPEPKITKLVIELTCLQPTIAVTDKESFNKLFRKILLDALKNGPSF